MKNSINIVFALLVITSMVMAACQLAEPEVVEVVKTVVVTEFVEGETVEIVKTEVVEVMVTPEPEMVEEVPTIYFNWGTEPPQADPALNTDTTSEALIESMFSGLTDIDDETKEAVGVIAESWESSEDATVWTFNMRNDVPWVRYNATSGEVEQMLDEDGNPRMTNAHDVEFAIKRVCDPNTASNGAWLLYPIAGCQALNEADPEAEDFQDLYDAMGVEALDDYTVQFTLAFGAGFFPQVVTVANLFPVYPPAVSDEAIGDRWVEPGFMVSNGAYVMTEWVHNDHITMVKNPFWPFWGTDYGSGNIEKAVGYMINEASTEFAMYENNEIDTTTPPGWGVPLDQIDRVKADPVLSQELYNAPINCTYYYGFVTQKEPVNDVNVRKALSMGVDRPTLVEAITKGGQIPANTFTNPLNFGHAAEDPDIAPWALTEEKGGTGYAAAVETGKGLLEEAGFLNGAGLDILLMYNDSESHARIAQAIQAMWQEAYPEMNVSVETQEWGVYLDTIRASTPIEQVPHVYRLGWCGSYPHANNWMLEAFHPDEGANRIRLSVDDPQVGELVQEYMDVTKTAQTAGEAEAKELYKRAEKLLNEEIAAIIPIYYYTSANVTKPWLTRTYDPIKLHLFQWQLDQDAQMAGQ